MSTRQLVGLDTQYTVQVPVGARPALAGDGVDITGWRQNGKFGQPLAACELDGTVAATINSPAGGSAGVELWAQRNAKWYLIGILNNGQTINIVGAGQGFAQEIDVVGVFDRLALAGTVSAGVVTANLTPMEQYT